MGSYQFNLINLVSYDLPHQFPESQVDAIDPSAKADGCFSFPNQTFRHPLQELEWF